VADDTHVNRGGIRYLCEALFSLHLAFAGMSMILMATTGTLAQLGRMERGINDLLHIPNTHLLRGYFAVWIPSVCVAALLWILLRALAHKPFAQRVLPSAMGIIILSAPAAFRLCFFHHDSWPVDWWPWAGLAETAICAVLLISREWKWPLWAAWVLLIAHYGTWYFFVPGSQFYSPGYNGPAGPILGLCSALAWSVYFKRLNEFRKIGAHTS